MTSRKLAQLCAQGILEWKHEPSNTGVIYHEYMYVEGEEDTEVDVHNRKKKVVARRFDEKEWHPVNFFDDKF